MTLASWASRTQWTGEIHVHQTGFGYRWRDGRHIIPRARSKSTCMQPATFANCNKARMSAKCMPADSLLAALQRRAV